MYGKTESRSCKMTKKELIALIKSMGFVKSNYDDESWTFPELKGDYFIDIVDDKLKIFSNDIDIDFENDSDFSDAKENVFRYKDKNPLTMELIKIGLQILIENYKVAKKKLRLDKIEEL